MHDRGKVLRECVFVFCWSHHEPFRLLLWPPIRKLQLLCDTGFQRKSSPCRCVWKPAFVARMCVLSSYLAAVPQNELVACISRLVPIYVLLADRFFSPPLTPLVSSPLCACFPLSSHCLFTSTADGNHRRCSQEQRWSLNFFVLSFPSPLFPSLRCRLPGMFGVSKLASVLGVPGEQPCHNSRAEWAGERAGEGN